MMRTITIREESAAGQLVRASTIELEGEHVTVRDIISAHIAAEVAAYNRRRSLRLPDLVHPLDAEKTLNGPARVRRTQVDAEKQVYIALDAFQKNSFFVLVDDVQAESLDQIVTLRTDSVVSFIRLTPLVGG